MNVRLMHRLLPLALASLLLPGCMMASPTSASMGDFWGMETTTKTRNPVNSVVGGGPEPTGSLGGAVSTPNQPVTAGTTTALFQTPLGAIGLKGPVVVRLGASNGPTLLWNSIPARYTGAITALSTGLGWGVGSAIGRYEGGAWTAETSDVDASMSLSVPVLKRVELLDVAFASGSTTVGYAVGTRGTVLKYDAARKHWVKQTLPAGIATRNFGAVKVRAANDVWVAGSAVARFDGASWTSIPLPAGAAALTGLAEGANGELWASTGDAIVRWNGSAWIEAYRLAGHSVGSPAVQAWGATVVGVALEPGVPAGIMAILRQGVWETSSVTVPGAVGLDNLVLADERTAFARAYDDSGVWKLDLETKVWSRYTD